MELDDLEAQKALNVGTLVVLAALIQTHPNHAAFQLALTSLLEQQIPAGALGKLLTSGGQAAAREMVEQLGGIRPQTAAGQQSADALARVMQRRG